MMILLAPSTKPYCLFLFCSKRTLVLFVHCSTRISTPGTNSFKAPIIRYNVTETPAARGLDKAEGTGTSPWISVP